jgi:S1-C subfamily serine protease
MKASWLRALWINWLCILWLSGFAVEGQVPKSETFYSGAQHAIIQLQYQDGQGLHTATGFFVSKGDAFYVVTAGHVGREPFSYTATVQILALAPDGTTASMDVRLTMPHESWVLHQDDGDATHFPVDVAAMKIAGRGGLKAYRYCPTDCPDWKGILLAKEDAEPPTPVLVFGFPLNEPGLTFLRHVPLGRQGIIGLVDPSEDEIQVDGKYFDRLGFIIDIPTIIGGSSGSPVLSNAPFAQQTLVGLISGSTDKGDPGAYARAGGYAIAEPVSRIKEVLDSPGIEKMPPVDTWCFLSATDAAKFKPPPFPVCQ